MVSKSKGHLEVTLIGDSVSIHKWFHDAGRFMSFTREEAVMVASLLQEVLSDPLFSSASLHPQYTPSVPE